jgi:UDP-N-acetylglucosamine 2-epimerase (non-hydrolysing)
MSKVFFDDLGLPEPHVNLGIHGGTHGEQVAQILVAFEALLRRERPAMVGVVGDVNSTSACALATAKSYVLDGGATPKLIHVEAGLRSGDRLMPEEVNRLITDALSDLLFTSEESGNLNLVREGVPKEKINFSGNVMVDSLFVAVAKDRGRSLLETLGVNGENPRQFALVTLHRPSNVDDPEMLRRVMGALKVIGSRIAVFFPVHPRTAARMKDIGMTGGVDGLRAGLVEPGLHTLDPLGYDDFLALMRRATVVITDSGGIQEETTALGIPCLTLRENTERPATVTLGTNTLLGRDTDRLVVEVDAILAGQGKVGTVPPNWDGHAAERIIEVLARFAKDQQ